MAEPYSTSNTHNNIAVIALTSNGAQLARPLVAKLSSSEENQCTFFLERRFYQDGEQATLFDLPARPVVQKAFREFSNLVIFLSAGACIRLLAPLLTDKHRDPAVVCVDDAGKFCVSLLSGHVGGADQLAQTVAKYLGAAPIITSASHASGTLAVDLLGQQFGWTIETWAGAEAQSVTRASAALVNLRPVGVYQEAGETDWWDSEIPLPENITIYPTLQQLSAARCDASLVITDRIVSSDSMPPSPATIVYRPRSLVVGIGCRKGVPVEDLETLLVNTFANHSLCIDSLACIATAELKRGEEGLVRLAEQHSIALEHYSTQELNAVFDSQLEEPTASIEKQLTRSRKAHSLVGVWGVAEPATLLASGASQLLVPREKTTRATIAISRRAYPEAPND